MLVAFIITLGERNSVVACGTLSFFLDDECFYYHFWRNNEVIAFGTLSFTLFVLLQVINN